MDVGNLLGRPERWASVVGWATLAGLEFGLIGPFGSYAANPFTRIIYWIGLFWVGSLLLWPSVVAAVALGQRRGFPALFSGIAVVLIVCVPLAALGAAGTYLLWPARASAMRIVDWYGLTIMVALPAIGALVWLELRGPGRTALFDARTATPSNAAQHAIGAPAMPAGDAALPDHLLVNALCLQMEDHHVRVHMAGRSHLHFAVLRDVVAALDERSGLQVHRSWWVARSAVRHWHKDGRSITLVLTNGLHVPVARNRVAILRAHGWLGAEA